MFARSYFSPAYYGGGYWAGYVGESAPQEVIIGGYASLVALDRQALELSLNEEDALILGCVAGVLIHQAIETQTQEDAMSWAA